MDITCFSEFVHGCPETFGIICIHNANSSPTSRRPVASSVRNCRQEKKNVEADGMFCLSLSLFTWLCAERTQQGWQGHRAHSRTSAGHTDVRHHCAMMWVAPSQRSVEVWQCKSADSIWFIRYSATGLDPPPGPGVNRQGALHFDIINPSACSF